MQTHVPTAEMKGASQATQSDTVPPAHTHEHPNTLHKSIGVHTRWHTHTQTHTRGRLASTFIAALFLIAVTVALTFALRHARGSNESGTGGRGNA